MSLIKPNLRAYNEELLLGIGVAGAIIIFLLAFSVVFGEEQPLHIQPIKMKKHHGLRLLKLNGLGFDCLIIAANTDYAKPEMVCK